MTNRLDFLLGTGALAVGSTASINRTNATRIAAPNIIISNRNANYLRNIPSWTPKEALGHPLTAILNQYPRFTAGAVNQFPNLRRVQSYVLPICGVGGCPPPPPPPTPSPKIYNRLTSAASVSAPLTQYAGLKLTADSPIAPIDSYGAHIHGFLASSGTYTIQGAHQNPVNVYANQLSLYAQGTYQYGTTTVTVHPTLPQVRFSDPIAGSGVVYFDYANHNIAIKHTGLALGEVVVMTYPSANQLPNPPSFMTKVGIGIGVLGIIIAAAGLLATAPFLGVAAAFLGIGFVLFGFIAVAFDAFGCEPFCPQAQSQPAPTPVGRPQASASSSPTPDGSGTGSSGSDQFQSASS